MLPATGAGVQQPAGQAVCLWPLPPALRASFCGEEFIFPPSGFHALLWALVQPDHNQVNWTESGARPARAASRGHDGPHAAPLQEATEGQARADGAGERLPW